jgi:hypothetical protein
LTIRFRPKPRPPVLNLLANRFARTLLIRTCADPCGLCLDRLGDKPDALISEVGDDLDPSAKGLDVPPKSR